MNIAKLIIDKKIIRKEEGFDLINPNDIEIDMPELDETFWHHHNESFERYKELVLNYNKALKEIKEKGSLDHLSYDNPIHKAYQVFHGSEPVKVIELNGKYYFDGSGRHRIIAAQILRNQGHDVKIYVRKTKYVPKENNNVKISVNPIKSNTMSYQIEKQIELLTEAKNVFVQHAQQLENLIQMFNASVRSLENDELNHDYVEFLDEFNNIYSGTLKTLIKDIEDEYIPEIIRKIRYLEERI